MNRIKYYAALATIALLASASPVIAATHTLDVSLSEDFYQGDANALISIDGANAINVPVTASHASGVWQHYTTTIANDSSHALMITFTNDAYGGAPNLDRNLYVGSVLYDGVAVPTAIHACGYIGDGGLACSGDNATATLTSSVSQSSPTDPSIGNLTWPTPIGAPLQWASAAVYYSGGAGVTLTAITARVEVPNASSLVIDFYATAQPCKRGVAGTFLGEFNAAGQAGNSVVIWSGSVPFPYNSIVCAVVNGTFDSSSASISVDGH